MFDVFEVRCRRYPLFRCEIKGWLRVELCNEPLENLQVDRDLLLFVEPRNNGHGPITDRLIGQIVRFGFIHPGSPIHLAEVFVRCVPVFAQKHILARERLTTFKPIKAQFTILVKSLTMVEPLHETKFLETIAIFVVHKDVSEGARVVLTGRVVNVGKGDRVLSDCPPSACDVDRVIVVGKVELLALKDERVCRNIEALCISNSLIFLVHGRSLRTLEKVCPVFAANSGDVLLDTIVQYPRVRRYSVEFEGPLGSGVEHVPSIIRFLDFTESLNFHVETLARGDSRK